MEKTASPLISIRGLTKAYGTFTVLHGIDLDVAEGEVVCVIGPSGSGKSTLIRCINHLEAFAPESTITVDGIRVAPGPALAKVRAEVGMVFQSFNLFPHMTVLRNVMIAPMRVRKTLEAEAERKARELLARVGISSRQTNSPASSRAVSSSVWPLPVRWRWSPAFCYSMSRHRRSIPKWLERC